MSERSWFLYADDLLEAAEAICNDVEGLSFEAFCAERMRQSAVIREFQIIGEAIGKLPEAIKAQAPQIPWQDIRDFRNLLVHEYFGVDLQIVWSVIHDDLPTLVETVAELRRNQGDRL